MNKWLRLLAPDGEGGGTTQTTPAPAAPAPEPTPAPSEPASAPDPAPTIPDRPSPITADVAEKLGVTTAKPIEVNPMAAMGLSKSPRESIADLIAKDSLKVTRNVPFTKPGQSPTPGVVTKPGEAKPAAAVVPQPPAAPTPPASPVAPAPVVPAAPAPPKYNVGGKEYTAEEMAAHLELMQRMPQQPVAQPVQPQPQVPVQPQRTPDQEREFVRQREAHFVNETAPHIDLSIAGLNVTPEQADIITAGGPPAVALHEQMRQREVAYATLLARKTIAAEMNPILKAHVDAINNTKRDSMAAVQPLLAEARQVAVYETEQAFVSAFPDLAPHLDTARIIGHELVRQYPDWARTVPRSEFIKVVAEQTPRVLQKFGITIQPKGSAAAPNPPATPPSNGNPPAKPVPTSGGSPKGIVPRGPKPISGQTPNRVAAPTMNPQTQRNFQKVAVDSIAAIR